MLGNFLHFLLILYYYFYEFTCIRQAMAAFSGNWRVCYFCFKIYLHTFRNGHKMLWTEIVVVLIGVHNFFSAGIEWHQVEWKWWWLTWSGERRKQQNESRRQWLLFVFVHTYSHARNNVCIWKPQVFLNTYNVSY